MRIYASDTLRETVAQSYPSALGWNPVGLPENYYSLLLSNGGAFTLKGTTLVGHGGISIQEVIVPLVKIDGRILKASAWHQPGTDSAKRL